MDEESENENMSEEQRGDSAEIWDGCFVTPEEKAYWIALASVWKRSVYDTVCKAFDLLFDQLFIGGEDRPVRDRDFDVTNDGMLRLKGGKSPFPLEPYSLIENTIRRKKEKHVEQLRKEAVESWYYWEEQRK